MDGRSWISDERWAPLGLTISCLLIRIGGAEIPVPVRTLVVALGDTPTVFIPIGIDLLATFQFTTRGSSKTRAVLDATTVTISSNITERTACKAPPHVKTPSVFAWWTGGTTPWMIDGISLFTNNLCGEFLLVVSVKEFPSLVQVANNESLFGLLMASTSSSESLIASTSSSESECVESLIVDWIVNLLISFIVSAWMSEAIRL